MVIYIFLYKDFGSVHELFGSVLNNVQVWFGYLDSPIRIRIGIQKTTRMQALKKKETNQNPK